MARLDHSPQIAKQTRFYGGSDNTSSVSEIGLRYVKANAKSKSEYLGELGETHLELLGDIGADMGRPSVFCCFRIAEAMPIRLIRIPGPRTDQLIGETDVVRLESQLAHQQQKHEAKYISCGLSLANGNGIGLDEQGWSLKPAPVGQIFITITTQSFSVLPFRVALTVGNPLVQIGALEIAR